MALIHHYKLEEDGRDSVGGVHLTLSGEDATDEIVTYPTAKLRNGFQRTYTENSSKVRSLKSLISEDTILLDKDFSYSAWVRLLPGNTSIVGLVCIFRHSYFSGVTMYISASKQLTVGIGNGTTRPSYNVTTVTLGTDRFYHVAFSYNKNTKTAKLYVDGKLERTITNSEVYATERNVIIGKWGEEYSDYGGASIIDDVRIYDHAISEREVRDLSLGMITHFKFDNDLYDYAQYTLGKPLNEPVYGKGKFGNALVRTTGYNRVDLETPINITDGVSYAFWLYYDYDTQGTAEIAPVSTNINKFHSIVNNSSRKIGAFDGSWRLSSYIVPDKEWHHYAYVLSSGVIALYVDGEYFGNINVPNLTEPIHSVAGSIVGSNRQPAMIEDLRIYTTTLTAGTIKELYQQTASIDSRGTLLYNHINESGIKQSIENCNWTVWEDGQTGSVTGFTMNGKENENSRIIAKNPWGKDSVVWKGIHVGTDSEADGGFSATRKRVDPKFYYRFSVWLKRAVLGNGTTYLGATVSPTLLLRRVDLTTDSNPYFNTANNGNSHVSSGDWFLWVGHIHPFGSGSGAILDESGIYNADGQKVSGIIRDFVWGVDEETFASIRSFLYYSTNETTEQYFLYPRMDKCDGTEPSLMELLNGFDSRNEEIFRTFKGQIPPSSIATGDINEICEVKPEGITDGLLSWFPLLGDTLDKVGSTTTTNSGAISIADGYHFNNSKTAYIAIENNLGYTNEVTACAWFRTTGEPVNAFHVILGGTGLEMSVTTSGQLRAGIVTGAGRQMSTTTDQNVADGVWHLLAFTYSQSSNKMIFYIDGREVRQFTTTGQIVPIVEGRAIGSLGISDTYYATNGVIRDVRFYNRVLTPYEMNALQHLTFPLATKQVSVTSNRLYVREIREC